MPKERYFLDKELEKKVYSLKDELHHLHVLRQKRGDFIEIVNGKNALAKALIIELSKKDALVEIQEIKIEKPSSHMLILNQALCRSIDWILEKATELGATHIRLFSSERSVKKTLNIERAHSLLISAIKQCNRLDLPHLEVYPSMQDIPKSGEEFFGDVREEAPYFASKSENLSLFIGPETGFSEEEVTYLESRAKGIKLNKNILRCETAALAGLAIFSFKKT